MCFLSLLQYEGWRSPTQIFFLVNEYLVGCECDPPWVSSPFPSPTFVSVAFFVLFSSASLLPCFIYISFLWSRSPYFSPHFSTSGGSTVSLLVRASNVPWEHFRTYNVFHVFMIIFHWERASLFHRTFWAHNVCLQVSEQLYPSKWWILPKFCVSHWLGEIHGHQSGALGWIRSSTTLGLIKDYEDAKVF